MYMSEQIKEKWAPVINHEDLPEIKDPYKRDVTRRLLENQEDFLKNLDHSRCETPVDQTAKVTVTGLFFVDEPNFGREVWPNALPRRKDVLVLGAVDDIFVAGDEPAVIQFGPTNGIVLA